MTLAIHSGTCIYLPTIYAFDIDVSIAFDFDVKYPIVMLSCVLFLYIFWKACIVGDGHVYI